MEDDYVCPVPNSDHKILICKTVKREALHVNHEEGNHITEKAQVTSGVERKLHLVTE